MARITNAAADGILSASIPIWIQNNWTSYFLQANPLFAKLKEQGQIKFGATYRIPIWVPSSAGPQVAGVSDPYAAVTHTAMDGATALDFTASEYLIPISMAEYDLRGNNSLTQKANWAEGVMKTAFEMVWAKLNAHLWSDTYTAASIGSRAQIMSILHFMNGGTAATVTAGATPAEHAEQLGARAYVLISNTASTAQTSIGGINRAATAGGYLCPIVRTTSDTFTVQVLSSLRTGASVNGKKPNYCVLPASLYDKLMSLFTVGGTSGGQFNTDSVLGKYGFEALRWGTMDIVPDDLCPTAAYASGTTTAVGNNAFMLNTDFLQLNMDKQQLDVTEVPDLRPIKGWKCVWRGGLIGQPGRMHSRHVNLTA